MKKIIAIVLALVIICAVILISPAIGVYREYFTAEKYNEMYTEKTFTDIFYEPESKECEVYSIGGFGCIDLDIIKNKPSEKEYYVKYSYRIFEEEIIEKLMNLLRECKFIPVERKEAFKLSLSLDEKSAVTSLDLSGNWFADEYNGLFSEKIVEEINEQCDRISDCTIFTVDGKLYLVGVCPTRIMGSSQTKYERPDFSETITVTFEIEMSESAKEILDSKDEFYPSEERLWDLK